MITMGSIIEAVYDLSLGLTLVCAITAVGMVAVLAFLVVKR
jgi:hypothetical protein